MPAEKIVQFPPQKQPKKPRKSNRRADGLVARHFRYIDLNGTSRRKSVYGRTISEAEQKKREFLAGVDMALRMDQQGRTVSQWLDEWVEVYKRPHVSAKRMQAIGYDVDRINVAIGDKMLKSVTQADLQAILNTRAGLSKDAISKTRGIITAAVKKAVENRLIIYSPAVGLISPGGTTGTHRALETWEQQLILTTAPGHRFGIAAVLMLFAGVRKGEVAALHSDDVDLKNGTITIRSAVSYVVNQGELKDPKSAAGYRTIPIMPPLRPFLAGLSGPVLPWQGEGPISLQAINNAFNSFLIACELKLNNHASRQRPYKHKRENWRTVSFRCHDLRHTYATLLYDAGVDVKTAQKWLGHATPDLTIKLYTHLSASREETSTQAAAKHFEATFASSGGKSGGKTISKEHTAI